jgi:hypothetical protein
MRRLLIALLATFALAVTGCGDDDDDGAAGSQAGSGGEAGEDGEAGEGGEAGGADSGVSEEVAQCIEDAPEARDPDCAACTCENCLQESQDCGADEGCLKIVTCAAEKDCTLGGCVTADTCLDVFIEVGFGSESVALATAAGQCVVDAGCSACPQPPEPEPFMTVSGTVVDTEPGVGFTGTEEPTEETPVEGMEICIFEHDDIPCVETDADGKFEIADVPNEVVLVSFTKDGYPSYLRNAGGTFGTILMTRIMDDEKTAEAVQMLGGTYPDDATGGICFGALTYNTDGVESPYAFTMENDIVGSLDWMFLDEVSVSLDPDSGVGPLYVDDSEQYDASLTETSEAGWGIIFNIEPGDYILTFSHPQMDCGQPTETNVRVVAGYITHYVPGFCVQP